MRFWSELGSSFLSCYPSYRTEKKFHSEEDPSLSQMMFKFLTKWHTLRQKQARLTHGDVLESACIDDPELTNGCAIRRHTYEVSSVQRMQFITSLNKDPCSRQNQIQICGGQRIRVEARLNYFMPSILRCDLKLVVTLLPQLSETAKDYRHEPMASHVCQLLTLKKLLLLKLSAEDFPSYVYLLSELFPLPLRNLDSCCTENTTWKAVIGPHATCSH